MSSLFQDRLSEAQLRDLKSALVDAVEGDTGFDNLSRTLFATDASIYEVTPIGVVWPRHTEDVVAVVTICKDAGVPVVARGAGTGLTGGAIGGGIVLDFSRHMDAIGEVDVHGGTVDVEPGVVLDDFSRVLAKQQLQFGPDVATSSRATLGGMIANNSAGAHSILYGLTGDHVRGLAVVLSDGAVVAFDNDKPGSADDRAGAIEQALAAIRDEHHDEIQARYPKVLRCNGGYALNRLGAPGERAQATRIVCGSEGTLGIVTRAKLGVVKLPACKGLVVLHFGSVPDALEVVPEILPHKPAAVELVDKFVMDAGRLNLDIAQRCDFLEGDPGALLVVEMYGDTVAEVEARLEEVTADPAVAKMIYASPKVLERQRQVDVWNLRKAGLGLLMSRPGDRQPYGFVEDTAVDPARLHDYIGRFRALLEKEGIEAGYYAHASVGLLHIRPILNLMSAEDVEKMGRIASAVCDLVIEFGGAVTGEHGDGLVRSCFLERLYGKRIIGAFEQVKNLFDPIGLLNPGKILSPPPMTEHLRYGAGFERRQVKTLLDFSEYGGLAGLAGMCSGVGQCRARDVGTMCPSYRATQDEVHTTRARANALRIALSNRGLLNGLDDPALEQVMDLCLACKACKTECPTGVDMAKLRAEYLSHRNLTRGVPARSKLIAGMPDRLKLASRFPRLSNAILQAKLVRAHVEHRYGLDRRVAMPKIARQTFRTWFGKHKKSKAKGVVYPRGRVIYFVDTWTNYFAPQVGQAAVKVLERAGYRVDCPATGCCGRPAISKGMLTEAKQMAEHNVSVLSRVVEPGVSIVGTEPSCILSFVDEYPQLVPTPAARMLADHAVMIETFLARLLDEDPDALGPLDPGKALRYHAHCHQKSLVGAADAVKLMERVFGESATLIDSGCCGMAGSFGHEVEHYDVAKAIGEERLFPAVRSRGDADIAISGFSCRQHIEHHTGAAPRHIVEYLAEALA